MNKISAQELNRLPQRPTRDGYGEGLVLAGKADPNIVVLCADLTESTRSLAFKKEFPDRFIQMGVSEQALVAIGVGLALAGKVPFTSSYAVFSPGRSWDQIRTNVCLNNANVKIAGAHAGVSVGPDGATHQALEDIAITRVLPRMTVIYPCDAVEAAKATVAAAKINGPVYLRYAREKTPVMTNADTPFAIGQALVLRDGNDCAIIACGPLLYNAFLAAEELAKNNINCRVINNHTIKPLDKKTLVAAAKECGAIVTVEEHQIMGGMGSAVAELLAQKQPVPIEFVGMRDGFGQSGEPNELVEHYGMGAKDIVKAVQRVMKRK
jgi:transketolase